MPKKPRSNQSKRGSSDRGVSVKFDAALYKALRALANKNQRTIVGQVRWMVAGSERA